jgi:hypothetical protein
VSCLELFLTTGKAFDTDSIISTYDTLAITPNDQMHPVQTPVYYCCHRISSRGSAFWTLDAMKVGSQLISVSVSFMLKGVSEPFID